MTRVLRVAAIAAAFLGASTVAGASPIFETEGNNSIAGAQVIPSSAFTTPVPPTVFADPGYRTATVSGNGGGNTNDVDFYAFMATGGSVYFDIDSDPYLDFDTVLALFDSAGTLLAYDDDSFPADQGSGASNDAFLGVLTLLTPGTYYIAVSEFPNFPVGTVMGAPAGDLSRPDGAFGGRMITGAPLGNALYQAGPVTGNGTVPYTLHISLQNPAPQAAAVPEPGTMLLFGAGMTALAARLRRRR